MMAPKGQKKKQKQKSQKKKNGTKNNSGVKGSTGSSSQAIMLAMGTCSISNPFCPEAVGARWPDNSFTKSNSFTYVGDTFGLLSTAGGNASAIFLPTLGVQFGGATAGTLTGSSADYNLLAAGYGTAPSASRYRVTSWGLKLQVATPAMTTQGTLRIRLFSPSTGASLVNTAYTTPLADAVLDIPLTRLITQDVFVIPMPLGTDARLFRPLDTATTMATWINPGWQVINVGATGCIASTIVVNIIMYYHYEVIPLEGTAESSFTKTPPSSNPVLRQSNAGVLEKIGNFVEGAAAKVDALFQSRALKYLTAGAGAAYGGTQGAAVGFQLGNSMRRPAIMDMD